MMWKEIARNKLSFFLEYESYGDWKPAKHLLYLTKKLEAVERGEIKRLMVFMPPRHGKSEVVTKKFPAWYLGRNPDNEVIISSYSADLAYDFSVIARETLRKHGSDLFDVDVSDTRSAVAKWNIKNHRGGLAAAGVGGPITGRGAHLAIIDDPFKNWEEASSKTIRDKVWSWYRSTLYTRLAPGGAIVLVMTRWHEDDIAGRLMQMMEDDKGSEWEIIKFKQYADDNDPLGRKEGETLWPERFPQEQIKETKEVLGSYLFTAMHQQEPSPEGGAIFKRSFYRYFYEQDGYYILMSPDGSKKKYEKSKCWKFQTCDPAATEKENSDFFVLTTFAVTPNKDLLIVDVFRERAETVKHISILRMQMAKHNPDYIGIENRTFGLNIIQTARNEGMPIIPLEADKDKVSRSRVIAARYEIGTVYHRLNAEWLTDVEDELTKFPNGEHDDVVDTISYAGIELMKQRKSKAKVKISMF